MKRDILTTYVLLLLGMIFYSFSLFAAPLSFDLATGRVYGFDLSEADSPDNPNDYNDSGN